MGYINETQYKTCIPSCQQYKAELFNANSTNLITDPSMYPFP